jgi:hypothetical protein
MSRGENTLNQLNSMQVMCNEPPALNQPFAARTNSLLPRTCLFSEGRYGVQYVNFQHRS